MRTACMFRGVDLASLQEAMPFANLLGVTLVSATPEEVRGTLAWDESRCTTGGVLHGGALMGLADTLGGVCAFLNLPPGAGTTTIESKTNFLRGVGEGVVDAVCRPLHVGRTAIAPENGRLCDAISRMAAADPVAKTPRMIRLVSGLSQWTMAMVSRMSPAWTSSAPHFTPFTDEPLSTMRWRRASSAFWIEATSSRWASVCPAV